MKKLFIVTVFVLMSVSFTACGTLTSGVITNNSSIQTNVVLSEANFEVIGTVSAETTHKIIFGFGGKNKKALRENAVAKLYEEAKLKGSQALINVTCIEQVKMVTPIFIRKIIIAKGTVVEFKK